MLALIRGLLLLFRAYFEGTKIPEAGVLSPTDEIIDELLDSSANDVTSPHIALTTMIGKISNTPLTRGKGQDPLILLSQAKKIDSKITLDELSATRLIASEYSSGSPTEWACIVDAELNRAERKKKTLTKHLTGKTGTYGPQGKGRPAATRFNGTLRQLAVARFVISGGGRGISRGAQRFFDPKVQNKMHDRYKRGLTPGRVHSCKALGTLKAWSFDLPKCKPLPKSKRYRCCSDGMPPSNVKAGRHPDRWVGPIPGVNAFKLMLMKPSKYGKEHDAYYLAAVRIIKNESGLTAPVDVTERRIVSLPREKIKTSSVLPVAIVLALGTAALLTTK